MTNISFTTNDGYSLNKSGSNITINCTLGGYRSGEEGYFFFMSDIGAEERTLIESRIRELLRLVEKFELEVNNV